jgi:two-component system, cell cycle response regulator DivK
MTSPQEPVFVYIEDDAPSRTIVQVLLTRVMNFKHITVFENSENLFPKLAALDPAPTVFLLDIQMKPLNGYEVFELLRLSPQYAGALMVAITANVMSPDIERLKDAGFDGLIGKPIVKDTFPQLIERLLKGQQVWFVP